MTDRAVMSVIRSSGWHEAGRETQLSSVMHNAFFFWPEKVSDRFALCERACGSANDGRKTVRNIV